MALPSSGQISTNDIVQEFGFPSGTIMDLRVQKPSSTTQVWIDGAWRNCNMCSPQIPDHIAPYILADDFYGYNHSAVGVTGVSINGNSNVLNGAAESYTSSVSYQNGVAIVYYWSATNGTINSGQGTASVNVTWTNAASGSLTLQVTSPCNGVTVQHVMYTTLACTAPSSVNISGTSAIYVPNNPYTYTLTYSGSNATSIVWSVGTYGSIVSGQGSNTLSVNWNFNNPYASQSSTISCTVTNACGTVTSNTITVNPSVYSNVVKSGTFTKNDCSGGWGSSETYTVLAGVYKGYSQADADNAAQGDVNTNGQTHANNTGYCTWGNDAIANYYTRNNCATNETGSTEYVTIAANTHTSTTSKAAANSLAQTAAQNYANTYGTCTANCAPSTSSSTSSGNLFYLAGSLLQYTINLNNPSNLNYISYDVYYNGGLVASYTTGSTTLQYYANLGLGSYQFKNIVIHSCSSDTSSVSDSHTYKVISIYFSGDTFLNACGSSNLGIQDSATVTVDGPTTPFAINYQWSLGGGAVPLHLTGSTTSNTQYFQYDGSTVGCGYRTFNCTVTINGQTFLVSQSFYNVN